MYYVNSYVRIRNGVFFKDGEKLISFPELSGEFGEVIRAFYKSLDVNYPAFYKMDNLSKLGFCASEWLLKDLRWKDRIEERELGVILANNASCLDTDEAYYDTIRDPARYFPSPSVFVYTLPNIVIGEICIRHKIKGENMFFIQPEFDVEFMVSYIGSLLDSRAVKACIGGWIEFYKDNYDAFMYFASPEGSDGGYLVHNEENIKKLYNTNGAIN